MKKNRLMADVWKVAEALVTRRLTLETDCIPFRFEGLSLKRILNLVTVGASTYFKPARPWGLPLVMQVEPAAVCNLKCTLCPVAEGMDRPVGLMEPALFRKVLDEVGDVLLLIVLWDWGEPFANPAIYEMIAAAKTKGIQTVSSTNGHLFARPQNAAKLVRSGLDAIIIAIDGLSQETYGRFRQPGRLETALQGLRNIVAAKREAGRGPLIHLRFIPTKHNQHEIPDLKALAIELGVDVLSIKTLNPYDCYAERHPEHYEAMVPDNERYQRFRYRSHGATRQRIPRPTPCTRPWDCITLRWGGNTSFCTYDYRERIAIGNVRQASVASVWAGPAYRALRRRFRGGEIDLCRNCSSSFEGGNCDGETVAEVFCSESVAELFDRPERPERVRPLID